MLVLGRKTGESVVISDNIVVTILSVERDQVKLGIEAPRQIPVVRKELFEALKAQNTIAERLANEAQPLRLESLRNFLAGQTSDEPGENDDVNNK